jgi:hypothetical protein
MDDLLALYLSLAPVSGSGDFYMARELTTRPNFRVAKDSDGNPTLLITPELSNSPAAPPLELRYLSFRPSEVRFKSELTDVPHLARVEVTRKGGLFEAIFG